MRFLTIGDAEGIIEIVKKYSNRGSFKDIAAEIAVLYPRICGHILDALKHFYGEKRASMSPETKEAWINYTGGFVRLSELDEKISEFCKQHNVNEEAFRAWLDGVSKVIEKRHVIPHQLAGLVNYLIIKSLLDKAIKAVIIFSPEIEGRVVREAIFRASIAQADVEYESGDTLKLTITAQRSSLKVFADICVLAKNIKILMVTGKEITIDLEKVCLYSSHEWPSFDSIIEEDLYEKLRQKGVKIKREPKAIKLDDIVFVPDFEVELRGKRIYVEVVGHWSKRYIINKEIKLRRALEAGMGIVVVMYEKLLPHFSHLPLKIITFKNQRDLEDVADKIIEHLGG